MKTANLFRVENENGQVVALFQCTNQSMGKQWIIDRINDYYNPSHPKWHNIKALEYYGIIEASITKINL